MSENNENIIENLIRIIKELEWLRHEKTAENKARIEAARAKGDLSENEEYDLARAEQMEIGFRIGRIESALKAITILEDRGAGGSFRAEQTAILKDVAETKFDPERFKFRDRDQD